MLDGESSQRGTWQRGQRTNSRDAEIIAMTSAAGFVMEGLRTSIRFSYWVSDESYCAKGRLQACLERQQQSPAVILYRRQLYRLNPDISMDSQEVPC